jgi:dihydroorotate dehydrogenase electron transfer subunit
MGIISDPGKDPPKDFSGRISLSEDAGSGCKHVVVETEETIPITKPGQFFMVRVSGVTDPLLGRPLSCTFASDDEVGFLFRVVGKGTSLLASLPPGARLDLRGPCGNGFPEPSAEKLVLVAGTLGIAPFLGLATKFSKKHDMTYILGLPGKGWEFFAKWCSSRLPGVNISTDDGSFGMSGTATELAISLCTPGCEVWGCGPNAMLETLGSLGMAGKILVSLESRMACGIGGCMGCSVETRSGMVRTCVEGPVFDWEEVVWDGR